MFGYGNDDEYQSLLAGWKTEGEAGKVVPSKSNTQQGGGWYDSDMASAGFSAVLGMVQGYFSQREKRKILEQLNKQAETKQRWEEQRHRDQLALERERNSISAYGYKSRAMQEAYNAYLSALSGAATNARLGYGEMARAATEGINQRAKVLV